MGKFKGKPSRQNSRSPGAGARGGGSYAPGGDKSLIPRVQEFAEDGGDPSDVAATVEHLRGVYREYLRKPANVFRKMVERACEEVRRRGPGSDAGGDALEAMEAAHIAERNGRGRSRSGDSGSGSDDSDDDSESGSDDDSDDDEGDSDGMDVDEPGADVGDPSLKMNKDLQKLYAAGPEGGDANGNGASAVGEEKPAFAPPHVVAAAAQRALAAEGKAAGAASNTPSDKSPGGNAPAGARREETMDAAAASHVAAVALARARRLQEQERSNNRRNKRDKRNGRVNNKKNKRIKSEFGDDFLDDYLPGGSRYKPGGVGNGPGDDPFGANGGGANTFQPVVPRDVKLADLGGIEESLRAIRELILCPLTHPELYSWLGVDPPRGVLLHGPPGCGKTTLAHAIAREAGVPFFSIAAPEIVAGVSGESEAKIRQLFSAAAAAAPSIVFIDEVDAIVPKRESAGRQMESRIVAQLLASMDNLNDGGPPATGGGDGVDGDGDEEEDEYGGAGRPRRGHVTVIGATNRPDGMDAALRRAGRFDREIMLGIPDENARARILGVQAKKLRLAGGLDLAEIAKKTPGYVGADLSALAKEAAASAVARIFKQLSPDGGANDGDKATGVDAENAENAEALMGSGRLADRRPFDASELADLSITIDDFALALTKVQPSAQREGFTTTPEVTWDDVGSLTEVREELKFSVCEPIAHPARFQAMGLAVSTGVLLYGPPGCGKTLVAKATANEANANFMSIKGPELLNKYVGESERAVRTLFARARAAAPCVLFFDELDSLAPRRGNEGNQASERVVNQLLTEMDGLEARSSTFVVAATNRPDMIDPAMLRPGRLDKLLYVPLPPPDGRAAILNTLTRRTPLSADVDVGSIGVSTRCAGFSGADLAALVREACVAALKGNLAAATAADAERERARKEGAGAGAGGANLPAPPAPPEVTLEHFEQAFERVQPSVSAADQRRYDELRRKLRRDVGSLKPKDAAEAHIGAATGGDGGTEMDVGGGGVMEGSGRGAPSLYAAGGSGKKRKV